MPSSHPQEFLTVGHLYRGIQQGLERLVKRYGEEGVFIGPRGAQATTEFFALPGLIPVTNLASANAAIDLIVEQGEGARGEWRAAHFGKFLNILEELLAAKKANLNFEPARNVCPAFVYRPPDVLQSESPTTDPLTAEVADLFTIVYRTTIQTLACFWMHEDKTRDEAITLAKTAVGLMVRIMVPLGELHTTLPVGPDRPGICAGPTFSITCPSLFLVPYAEAGRKIICERLDHLANTCVRIAQQHLQLQELGKLEQPLRSMAASVREHIDKPRVAQPESDASLAERPPRR